MKIWQKILLVLVSMVLTLWAYAYWVIGPENLSQPGMRMRFSGFKPDPSWLVLLLLILPLVVKRWLPSPTPSLVICLYFAMLWVCNACSMACEYAFYFGNTWEYHELWLGFVILEPKAIALLLIFTGTVWLIFKRGKNA